MRRARTLGVGGEQMGDSDETINASRALASESRSGKRRRYFHSFPRAKKGGLAVVWVQRKT